MKPKHNLIIAAGILILAISGNAIWLSEILYRFTWASLAWLSQPLYSPYLLAVFPVVAFLLPFVLSKRVYFKKILSPLIILYFINLSFYHFEDKLLRMYFGKFSFLMVFNKPNEQLLETALVVLFPMALFLLFGLSYSLAVRYFLVKIRPLYIVLFALIIIPVLPLSCFTYMILRLADSEGFFNAIKTGYPVFWTTVLMGLTGWIIEKRTRETLQSNTP